MPDQIPDPSVVLPRKSKRENLDKEFAQRYFTLLIGQYKTMTAMADDPRAREEADSIANIPPERITWEDIYRLELAILKLEPFEGLCRKAWILREEYQEIASASEKAQYAASNPPKADSTGKESDLRADLVRIQEELNWAYTVLWVLEEFRSGIATTTAFITLGAAAAFGITVAIGLWPGHTFDLTLPNVAFAGILGGSISTLRRIHITKFEGSSDLNLIELEKAKRSIYMSPLLGAVFAIVLCALFASGLVKGPLFPEFGDGGNLLFGCFSLQCVGHSKLFVWSFIAGFAEQLVPDRLDQLSKRANSGGHASID